jgi:glycosyltransferase involved in cell wall biosynthesis
MKIAIYSGSIPSTTFIENLIKGLAGCGHEALLFGKWRKQPGHQKNNIKIYPSPESKWQVIPFVLWHQMMLWLRARRNFNQLRRHICTVEKISGRRWRLWAKYLPVVLHLPDIFHIQWAKATEEWMFLKELFGARIVLSLRGAHINYSPLADEALAASYRRAFPKAEGFHAVSEAIAKEAFRYGAAPEKTRVIYSGLDLEKIRLFEKKEFERHQPVRILSVGRFHWKKGYACALDALRILLDKGYGVHYTLIAGEEPEEILYQIHDLGLGKHVSVMDNLPQAEVFRHMQASDLLLLPSVEEGIANVVLEAMAIGLPVVTSDCGGMREVVEDGVHGFLFQNRNVNDMARQVMACMRAETGALKEMTGRAKGKVSRQHNLEQLAINMNVLYQQVMGQP